MATITYQISEDTYINSRTGYEADINGTATELKCRCVSGQLSYSMLKVSTITEIEGKTITSATLKAYCNSISATGWTNGIHVESIDSSWSESTASYNNKPTWGSVAESNASVPSGTGWVDIDITDIVQEWANGNNYGVILFGESGYSPSTTTYVHFYSTEGTNHPYIDITYEESGSGASTYSLAVEIVYPYESDTAESGTTTTVLKMTGHGLSGDDDFIVNTTRRSNLQNNPERGCRRITSMNNNEVAVEAIAGQTSGDTILKFRKIDVSQYVNLHSFNLSLVAEKEDSLSFDMIIPTTNTSNGSVLLPHTGQYCYVKKLTYDGETLLNTDRIFLGIISQINYKMYNVETEILATITVIPLKNRAYKRTIFIDYAKGTTTSTIITAMIAFLQQEGIEAGTINTGKALTEAWKSDCISVGEVLDELASRNEFMWYIDEDFKLQFLQDITPTETTNDLVDTDEGGTFLDYRNVIVNDVLGDYCNKSYSVGGADDLGNCIIAVNGDYVAQNELQAYTAGSGVYGEVNRNGSNTDNTEYAATTGTTTTNLAITSHPFAVGDYIYNKTRNLYGFVTAIVNANAVTTTSITNQASGDIIYYYSLANSVSKNVVKRQSTLPITLTFHSFNLDFRPQQKLFVRLKRLNIFSKYFNIEKVDITDAGAGYFNCNVTAVMRNNSNFSTQRRRTMESDFFKNF